MYDGDRLNAVTIAGAATWVKGYYMLAPRYGKSEAAAYRAELVAKLAAAGVPDPEQALAKLDAAAVEYACAGLGYNLATLVHLVIHLRSTRDQVVADWEAAATALQETFRALGPTVRKVAQDLAEMIEEAQGAPAVNAGRSWPPDPGADYHHPPTTYARGNGRRLPGPGRKAQHLGRRTGR